VQKCAGGAGVLPADILVEGKHDRIKFNYTIISTRYCGTERTTSAAVREGSG
jgi:hypothetical protein